MLLSCTRRLMRLSGYRRKPGRCATSRGAQLEKIESLLERCASWKGSAVNFQRHRDHWCGYCKGTRTDAPNDYLETEA